MTTVGILGAGQLAQLLAHSAYQLGLHTLCYADNLEQPAARNSKIFVGRLDDATALATFAKQCDVITLENENIATGALTTLTQHTSVYPQAEAVACTQDRLFEKQLFQRLNIATPPFAAINNLSELEHALHELGTPAVLKTRRFGYDGKGQFLIRDPEQAKTAWQAIGEHAAILEGFIAFDYEVSIIAARSQQGECVFYPLIKNTHRDGILRISECPIAEPALQQQAEAALGKVLAHFNYVGVLTLELFVKAQHIIANELAPRVHNSGHLTIEACDVSQFENHLRAVSGLPLIRPKVYGYTQMLNIIGAWPQLPDNISNFNLIEASAGRDSGVTKLGNEEARPRNNEEEIRKWKYYETGFPNLHIYDYGKTPRPGRKLGHFTLFGAEVEKIQNMSDRIRKHLL